jgi:DNA-binding LacI/PurR family transcriptional regulator
MSDIIAIGALSAASDKGIKIPDDISIIGFDDIPFAKVTCPPLTTVHQPLREKGKLAAELLVQNIEGKEIFSQNLLTTRLVVRGSVGKPPNNR